MRRRCTGILSVREDRRAVSTQENRVPASRRRRVDDAPES
ncbi:unnamed protein product [Spirodela intermedia]|uniref:Uncharacterized protein n=1 Tax=Spirodela intermedia TaxID=51605 RepID=A0A7I8LMN3_SPIIN|nr:unnamed protein product [Spirodela intermedia]